MSRLNGQRHEPKSKADWLHKKLVHDIVRHANMGEVANDDVVQAVAQTAAATLVALKHREPGTNMQHAYDLFCERMGVALNVMLTSDQHQRAGVIEAP